MQTRSGFYYSETPWTIIGGIAMMKYGIAHWNEVEVVRVPGIVTLEEFEKADPGLLSQLDENLINSVDAAARIKLGWD